MKKVLGFLAIITFLAAPLNAAAAVKAGETCKKAGITATASSKKFTCVRSGEKLVWNKGVLITKPKQVESATSTPSSKAKPVPSNMPLPSNWPLEKPADARLILIADSAVRKYIANATISPKINLLTGPKTDRIAASEYVKYLNQAAIGWGKDWLPEEVDVALAQIDDYEWIRPIWKKYGLNGGGFDDSEANWRRNGPNCNQGSAISGVKPFFWGCMPINQLKVIGLTKFGPHEYTHLVQYGIIYFQSGKKVANFPFLLAEGSADFYGVTYASTESNVQINWENYWTTGYFNQEARIALKGASESELAAMLNDAMRSGKIAPQHWYWTGAYATARLVAAKGHEGFVSYMRKYGESGDVFKSFEDVYGMPFEKFAALLAPEIKNLARGLRG
jgi:hypothetical protein